MESPHSTGLWLKIVNEVPCGQGWEAVRETAKGQKKVGAVFSWRKTALKAKGFITLIDGDLKEMGHLN